MREVWIVDDDVETVQGLQRFIDWDSLGFSVGGTATSAEEALPALLQNRPALLITDITMGGETGFDLVEKARRELPLLQVIFLTCHSDFEYAHAAIDAEAAAYLTKVTLTEETLIRALNKVKKRFREQDSLLETVTAQRSALLERIEQSAEEHPQSKGTGFRLGCYYFLDVDPLTTSGHSGAILSSQARAAAAAGPTFGSAQIELAFVTEKEILLVEWLSENSNPYQWFEERAEALAVEFASLFGHAPSLAISRNHSSTEPLGDVYRRLADTRDSFFYDGPGRTLNELDGDRVNYPPLGEFIDREQFLSMLRDGGNGSRLFSQLEGLKQSKPEPREVRELIGASLTSVQSELSRLGSGKSVKLEAGDTFEGCTSRLRKAVSLLEEELAARGEISAREEINRVARYVVTHLGEELSAEAMADLAGMSVAYFSRTFKKECGLTYSMFVTERRIEKARSLLLRSDMTVEGIARELGYDAPPYFYRLFKRITGATPGEYRERQRRETFTR